MKSCDVAVYADMKEAKIDEAIRLGIKNILVPKTTIEIKDSFQKIIQIKEISNINEAINYALKK